MKLDPRVREKYPEFIAGYVLVSGVTIEPTVEGLVERKREVFSDLKARYGALNVLDIPEVKSYRGFFKAMGADPSSYRPAPEYLLRRAIDDRFPAINNLVDSCLLATVEHWVSAGVYDVEKIKGEPRTTLATELEPFELIDGRKLSPRPDEIILQDDQKVLSAYTLGDSKLTKVTQKTSNALIVLWNAPGITRDKVEACIDTLATYTRKYCGGHVERSEVL
ncbi:MAG: phenylalanine--tRNA ligase beta subunit-related protein [Candidatus Hodarchaeaceae archaeon]|nr:phenylalanine--tRNA ligase beta subunit-related protein [Candidatus Hodarchaeaceae archaeon]